MIPTPKDAAKVLAGRPLDVRRDRLNVVSLLAQAAIAFRNGNPQKAFLYLGAASVAPRYPGLSWAVQGAVAANDVRKRLM
ncbi:hypothetical protein NGM10_00640 [Halorussus salilacus]|uniref:hypothetical protein n=1 Tax=Halorussus salilacus TaxID=2953750 RepID=UPI00209CCE0A|nr:hypothetical protein [Halorussus salilacus]USZ68264.1 hypothetical protein NGM10_00640 [Halorussus salilacus]